MGFVGEVAGRLDFTGDWGSVSGERYEEITVRCNVKNSLIVKVY